MKIPPLNSLRIKKNKENCIKRKKFKKNIFWGAIWIYGHLVKNWEADRLKKEEIW